MHIPPNVIIIIPAVKNGLEIVFLLFDIIARKV
jgi:hypothetical protein